MRDIRYVGKRQWLTWIVLKKMLLNKIIMFSQIFTYLQDTFHYISPCFIHSCKSPPFLRPLRHNVRRTKNGLQIQPCGLDLEPFIQNLLKQQELALPLPEKQNTVVLINSKSRNVSHDKTQNQTVNSTCNVVMPISIHLPTIKDNSLDWL